MKAIEKCKDIYATENGTVPIPPVLARIKVSPAKSTSSEIQRLQFPISLAWACTVDKVQGLTLNEIVVGFNLNRQINFNYGQIWIACNFIKKQQMCKSKSKSLSSISQNATTA